LWGQPLEKALLRNRTRKAGQKRLDRVRPLLPLSAYGACKLASSDSVRRHS
jgi:hypothetical protein